LIKPSKYEEKYYIYTVLNILHMREERLVIYLTKLFGKKGYRIDFIMQ